MWFIPAQVFVKHDESHEHRVGHDAQANQRERDGRLRFSLWMALERPAAVGHCPVGPGVPKVWRADHYHRDDPPVNSPYEKIIYYIFHLDESLCVLNYLF